MKQALIAVGVFAALLGVYFATRDTGNVSVGVAKLDLPKLDATKVTMVEMTGAQTLTLKKDSTGWTVADASKAFKPADEGHVTSLLSGLADLKTETFVTENPAKLAELELDEAKGLHVAFTSDGAPPLAVVFGKQGKLGGNYLRAPKSNQVFLTNSRIAQDANHQFVWWRKRAISAVKADAIAELTVKHEDGTTLALASKDGAWTLASPAPAGFRFDPAAAQKLATTLGTLWATDFLEQDPFTGPHATVEAKTKDGKAVTVHLGTAGEKGVPVKVDGDAQLYVISADQAAGLKKKVTDLADTTFLAFDPAKATKLTFTAAGKKTVLVRDGVAWKVTEPKALPPGLDFDPAQVAAELGRLKGLRGEAPAEAKGKPAATVEVTLSEGPAQKLEIGDGWAKGTADGKSYALAKAELTRLEKPLDLFKRPAPPPQQQLRLEDLPPDIRAKLEAQMRQQMR